MKKIEMTGVPETMIQTLYARAMESEREGHLIYDKKAMEIVKEMDYDFTKAKEDTMMRNGVVARTIVLDELVQNYVTAHPNAVVINIACGLDTRFYRVDNGKLRWFNLDLPVTIEVRKKFLEENAKKAGVNVTDSGLQYEILTEGNGNKPSATDKVRVHYTGTLPDGTVFDSSVARGAPAEFPVNGVIRGWVEALQMMPVGSKWKLTIPHELAYGERGAGASIPPFSPLVFEVELLDIL